ncbi:MAG: alpha/beta hydrolase [Zhongshania sp.]|uniref:alpha/beta fold hydrolase n=1 Tax=Zhongshania sp. TaxID=1971902 RepID=UPI002618A5F1|nr:alpha/beta hydrolase [Zhongshania sp.]MDF1693905.1 alpha/beta hydrolase [Zhongshania sp.]
MEFVEYGKKEGGLVVYFHGVPGAIEECALFDNYAKNHNLRLISFDRFSIDNSLDRESYYQAIADQIKLQAGTELVDLIGFSIGAHVALEVGALLSGNVRYTHLISAAAPLNAGDFIGNMAGGVIFTLAMEKPFVFLLLTQCQKLIAFLAPRMLVNMLFSSSTGKDKELSGQPDFKNYITPVLKICFKSRVKGYIRDINFYVTWLDNLNKYKISVHLWHGTKDNWSPYTMASYLCDAIPSATGIEAMEGLSHYSCLYEAAPQIFAKLEKS